MLENIEGVATTVSTLMGAFYSKVPTGSVNQAVQMALYELNWTLPMSDPKKEYWIIERAKRNMVFVVLVESALKFQYEKIYLNQRYAQLFKLIEKMDADFQKAIDENPFLFDAGSGIGGSDLFSYIAPVFTKQFTYWR